MACQMPPENILPTFTAWFVCGVPLRKILYGLLPPELCRCLLYTFSQGCSTTLCAYVCVCAPSTNFSVLVQLIVPDLCPQHRTLPSTSNHNLLATLHPSLKFTRAVWSGDRNPMVCITLSLDCMTLIALF